MLDLQKVKRVIANASKYNSLLGDLVSSVDEIKRLRVMTVPSGDVRIVKYRFFDYALSLKLGRKRTFVGEIIKRRSKLTHSEFQFSSFYNDISFSATIEDAFKGCRFKLIRYSHGWWRTVEWTITAEQEANIWLKAHSINGKKYDLFGIMGYATPLTIIRPHRDKYWCSESNAFITKSHIYTGKKTEIIPDELYKWLRTQQQQPT